VAIVDKQKAKIDLKSKAIDESKPKEQTKTDKEQPKPAVKDQSKQ